MGSAVTNKKNMKWSEFIVCLLKYINKSKDTHKATILSTYSLSIPGPRA